ncbi:hypothetical protein SHAb15599_00061 [Acinetobacter phage SH-Ab 15599]|nr:hypothetical protein SHAb15599_00061 [Acinetobacter phage SH-Ab 15599]
MSKRRYTEEFKDAVKAALKKGLHARTVAKQYDMPLSTVRLWADEIALSSSNTTNTLDKVAQKAPSVVTRRPTDKAERKLVSSLVENFPKIDLQAYNVVGTPSLKDKVEHFIIRDFNISYDPAKNNLKEALERSINRCIWSINHKQSQNHEDDSDIKLHFIGDHFNTDKLTLKNATDMSHNIIFIEVLNSIRQLIATLKESRPRSNVTFQIEGIDFRSSLLDTLLKSTFNMPIINDNNNLVFLSGLLAKKKNDEFILSGLPENPYRRFVHVDLTDIEFGPQYYCFGKFNLSNGIISLSLMNGSDICTLSTYRWDTVNKSE